VTQVHSIYRHYIEACEVLEVQPPHLFIQNNPFPNAYTYGYTNPFVVVTTGLLKDFDEDELMFILGHELGQLKCGHTLYNTMAQNLTYIIGIISDMTLGIGGLVTQGIQLALLEWSRKAEFSADRAGLLAVQDRGTASGALSKLMAPDKGALEGDQPRGYYETGQGVRGAGEGQPQQDIQVPNHHQLDAPMDHNQG
jgi:Zn-dependent protease with chaperone function